MAFEVGKTRGRKNWRKFRIRVDFVVDENTRELSQLRVPNGEGVGGRCKRVNAYRDPLKFR